MTGAYPGFCSMKQLRKLLLPLDGMLVHRRLPIVHLGGERQCGIKFLVYGNNMMAGTGLRTTDLQI